MPYFQPVQHGRRAYSLDHLDPFRMEVYSSKLARQLRVRCRFTNHVFSSRMKELNAEAGDIATSVDDRGSKRFFDEIRYTQSLALPHLLQGIAAKDLPVWQTAESKIWVAKIAIENREIVAAKPLHYLVFFSMERFKLRSNHADDLDMTVQTAYGQDPAQRQPNLLGKAKFGTVVTQAFLGIKINTHKPR